MERKLATVLFVDLVASTEFVAGSDPEVVRRRVTRFFAQHRIVRPARLVARCDQHRGGGARNSDAA